MLKNEFQLDIKDVMLAKQNQQQAAHKQLKNKQVEGNVKLGCTDFSMSDSMSFPLVMNRTGNVADESAMELAGVEEGDSLINQSH
ncbi:hypothetical protein BpHYR1_025563 [Brachionus plicatilis]|uniref:Uncharacterized protein n=1 Tax=Brachionus plicatilis TaxID=10195 RepID=A0A3M7Q2T2_BRAPC|nr:hypothetical protein BpHYR1_025563 [Brachionus plicatilis]